MTDAKVEELLLEKFLDIKTVSDYARCFWYWEENKDFLLSTFNNKSFKLSDLDFITVTDMQSFYNWYLSYFMYPEWKENDLDVIEKAVTDKKLTTIQKYDSIGNIRSDLFPDVAVENKKFQFLDDEEEHYWYEVWFLPSTPIQAELGTKGRVKWVGNIQINICVPKNYGTKASRERYEEIADFFRSGTIWEGVRIFRTYRGKGVEDEICYTLPITVEWHAYLER